MPVLLLSGSMSSWGRAPTWVPPRPLRLTRRSWPWGAAPD